MELAGVTVGHLEARASDAAGATPRRRARFLVAAVGEFKRDKSTLISALVDEGVLPTGVLQGISVAAELAYGGAGAVVERSGTRTNEPSARPRWPPR